MKAADILKDKGGDVVTISPDASIGDAITLLADKNIGAVIVSHDGGAVDGVISERDIIRVLNGAPVGFRETAVSSVMTKHVFTATPEATIDELLDMMTNKRIRHVPICLGDQLVGILSIGDVVKHRIREAEGEARALKDYISAG